VNNGKQGDACFGVEEKNLFSDEWRARNPTRRRKERSNEKKKSSCGTFIISFEKIRETAALYILRRLFFEVNGDHENWVTKRESRRFRCLFGEGGGTLSDE